ncbi:YegP family protein [soil metagenome]
MAGKFEVYRDANGEFRWRLKASNGQVIATGGEGYTTKSGCLNGIESVKTHAPDAEIEDQAGG